MTIDPEGLISRIGQVLHDDPRVLAAWLSGSRGRGSADRHSDIDVWLVVPSDDVRGFVEDWPAVSDRISPTVLCQQVGGGPLFTAITPEWLRFDVAIGTPDEVGGRSRTTLEPLFDRAGLTERLQPAATARPRPGERPDHRVPPCPGPAAGRARTARVRDRRIGRRAAAATADPADAGGRRRRGSWRGRCGWPGCCRPTACGCSPSCRRSRRPGRRPSPATSPARAFLPLARDLHVRCGLTWPTELEDAARRHLRAELDLEVV